MMDWAEKSTLVVSEIDLKEEDVLGSVAARAQETCSLSAISVLISQLS